MIEEIIDVETPDGAMETFICRPERGAPAPAVLLLMDAPGVREELYDMARRLASTGFATFVPNLYYRFGRDTKYDGSVLTRGSEEQKRMRSVRTNMTIPPAMEDVGALIAFAEKMDGVSADGVGVHGYCMSGPYALAAAARFPDKVKAAASFYGTWLVNEEAEESPHLTFGQAKGEYYISCAEHDELAPLDMVAKLKDLFDRSGARGELEMQDGVHHGFAFPGRWCYDRPAAERHWERLIALYRRNLG